MQAGKETDRILRLVRCTMDIYRWINSKDIAGYNCEIGHRFHAMESAFLVWQSLQHTMDERFVAWEEIIDTMPDTVMEKRNTNDWFVG